VRLPFRHTGNGSQLLPSHASKFVSAQAGNSLLSNNFSSGKHDGEIISASIWLGLALALTGCLLIQFGHR
jgi:hypothetical protein